MSDFWRAFSRMPRVVAVLAVMVMPQIATALSSFNSEFNAVYPDFGSASPTCNGCHVNAGSVFDSDGKPTRNNFGTSLVARWPKPFDTSTLRAHIREVGELDGFEPTANAFAETSNQSLKISPSRTGDISILTTGGRFPTGGNASINEATVSPATSLVSAKTNGNLTIGTLTPGATATFRIIAKNTANYRNSATFPNQLTLTVNRVPVLSGGIPAQPDTDDNQTGRYQTAILLGSFSDPDGDTLTGVTTSVTVQEIRTETNALDTGSYALSPALSSAGVLSFLPTGFDALNAGESRTVTFAFDVTDGTDTASGTVKIKVDGVPETGTNVQPAISARTLSVSAGALPTSTDLTESDGGTPFNDPDGDALSVGDIRPDLSSTPQFTLTGNDFGIADAAVFTSLAAGQIATESFDYDIVQTRPVTGETYLITNSLTVTVTGVNDPLTAQDFTATLDEGNGAVLIDLAAKTMWSDPDTSDVLSATNLSIVSQSAPLFDNGTMSIINAGTTLKLTPEFESDLSEGDVATVVVAFDVTDGNGSTKTVRGTLTIVGQAVSHTTLAGLYANSLAELYPLADFQMASSQPAACFTCHNITTVLLSAKPNCDAAKDFSPFGSDLCNDDRGGNIGARLERIEPKYAPRFLERDIVRYLSTSDEPGFVDETPIRHSPGLTVDGDVSTLHSVYLRDDFGGSFEVTAAGQVRLVKSVPAGRYVLEAYPMNISGAKTASGEIRKVPGFYPQASGPTRIVVEVSKDRPIAVADTFNVEGGKATLLPVLENDRGNLEVDLTTTAPANGTAKVQGQQILYTPNAGFTGSDSFQYTSTSRNPVGSATATVTVTVVKPGGLLAADDFGTVAPGQTVTIRVLENDANAGDGTTVTVSAPPGEGQGATRVVGQTIQFTASEALNSDVFIGYTARNPDIDGVNGSSAVVRLQLTKFGSGVLSDAVAAPELKAVAGVLDESCLIVSGLAQTADRQAFLAHCGNIIAAAEAGEDLTQTIRALQNEEHFAAVDAVKRISRGIGRAVHQRLTQVRGGAGRGFDGRGLSIIADGEALPLDVLSRVARAAIGMSLDENGIGSTAQFDPVWGGFVSGQIALTTRGQSATRSGYDITATNVVAGADYDAGGGRVIGGAIGYSQTETAFSDGGSLSGSGLQYILYGSQQDFLRPGLTLDGFAAFGKVQLSSERVIRFDLSTTSVDTVAFADFDARFINIAPQLSYSSLVDQTGLSRADIRHDLLLTWFTRLDYLHMKIDGYTETGGDGLALTTDASEYDSLLLVLGVKASRPIHLMDNVRSTAYGSLSVNGELLDRVRSVTSSFAAAGPLAPTFVVTEDGLGGLGGAVEFGTEMAFANGGTFDVALSYEIDADDARTTTLRLGYRTSLGGPGMLSMGATASDSGGDQVRMNATAEYALEF